MSASRSWVLKGDAIVDGVSTSNRGLAYGDGLFETMRIHRGGIPLLAFHWQRMSNGLSRLGIPQPPMSLQSFLLDCCRSVEQGVIKLIVTRGEGGRGYLPAPDSDPVMIVSLHDAPVYEQDYSSQGIAIGICALRLGKNPLLAGLKHLNRLEQVLIRQALQSEGFLEGLVLDRDDLVVEGAFSNICIVSGTELRTPLLDEAGVAGVLRTWVSENAPSLGLGWNETPMRVGDVFAADEVFLCNSVNGIWPVTAIQDQRFEIGPWTRALQRTLAGIF